MTVPFALPRILQGARTAPNLCILDFLDRIVGEAAPRLPSAPELIALARRRTGLTDFGDGFHEEPLQVLLRSYEQEASLSAFGRMAARWDMLRFLSNLLLLRRAELRDPAILKQPLAQPIFITGLPRSATTFLHNLFCQDGANRYVRCWETIYPCVPEERAATRKRGARAAKVDRQLGVFARLAPEVRRIHPMTARSPQECTEITGHVFRSLRFDTTHHVPSYRSWLDKAGHAAAYGFHRRFLQHRQHHRGAGQWVLKSPDHVFALDAIRQIYPDARFIFVHRNPLDVLPSVAELTEVLRRPFTRNLDRRQLAREVSDQWARGAEILTAEAGKYRSSPHVVHLEFRDIVEHPVPTMASLYERFGLRFSDELATQLRDFIATWPNGGYRRDKTLLEEYAVAFQGERGRYRDYMACFGL